MELLSQRPAAQRTPACTLCAQKTKATGGGVFCQMMNVLTLSRLYLTLLVTTSTSESLSSERLFSTLRRTNHSSAPRWFSRVAERSAAGHHPPPSNRPARRRRQCAILDEFVSANERCPLYFGRPALPSVPSRTVSCQADHVAAKLLLRSSKLLLVILCPVRCGAPQFFAHLSIQLFPENFRPRSPKVRSPGHVKWPHLRKSLNACHSYIHWPVALKQSGFDIRNSIYTTFISEFGYLWSKVRSILRPLHYKLMGWNWKASLLDENHSKHFKHRVTGKINTLNRHMVTSDPFLCHRGHFGLRKVTSSFSAIILIQAIVMKTP